MLTLFTALEARAISYLTSPEDFSIYIHIEIRILDSVQHGATHLLYAGNINDHVTQALRALGYEITYLQYEGKDAMIRIDWTNIMCPDSLVCPKEVKGARKNAEDFRRTGYDDG
jgi:hypothetical protein